MWCFDQCITHIYVMMLSSAYRGQWTFFKIRSNVILDAVILQMYFSIVSKRKFGVIWLISRIKKPHWSWDLMLEYCCPADRELVSRVVSFPALNDMWQSIIHAYTSYIWLPMVLLLPYLHWTTFEVLLFMHLYCWLPMVSSLPHPE